MITQQKTCLSFYPDWPFCEDILREQCLFVDIETTGLSPAASCLYLIGVSYYSLGEWHTIQWFCEDFPDERGLLLTFSAFARPYRYLIHFNGNRFDLPYLSAKYARYHLPDPIPSFCSVDLFQAVRSVRKLLSLEKTNQRALERLLNIRRADQNTGKDLIRVWTAYQRQPAREAFDKMLLHNYEDLCGMLSITAFCSYLPLTVSSLPFGISISDPDAITGAICGQSLCIRLHLPCSLPLPVQRSVLTGTFTASASLAEWDIPLREATLHYYFDDYKNYYYLPAEDQAIHKSVGVFVDPQHREKATADTCYIKKRGSFLPQCGKTLFSPSYKDSRNDRISWFLCPENIQDPVFLAAYVRMLKAL